MCKTAKLSASVRPIACTLSHHLPVAHSQCADILFDYSIHNLGERTVCCCPGIHPGCLCIGPQSAARHSTPIKACGEVPGSPQTVDCIRQRHAEDRRPTATTALPAGMAPAIPHPARNALATDTRLLDARQIGAAALRTAQSLSTYAQRLVKRIPTILRRASPACDAHYINGCYQGLDAGPTPGAVVGIVLGSIVGFLFLLWLLWILSSGTSFIRTTALEEEDVVVRRRSRSPRSRRSHRSSYREEMRHTSSRPERVIRQERIVRDVPPPRVDSSRVRESVIVEESRPERRVDGDDIVEVIEEHSSIGAPPPRRKSRRSSGYR